MVASTTARLEVSSGPGSDKVLLSFFRFSEKFSVVAESGILPSAHPSYMGLIINGEKLVHCTAALRTVMCTSAYPVEDKRRNVAYCFNIISKSSVLNNFNMYSLHKNI
ncbi:hypothetical protein SFRURICE_013753 [Spodoptera frugiperda]|nr:hypothetical protein SFRURICE_013753 [Spodoptera frugiperda]